MLYHNNNKTYRVPFEIARAFYNSARCLFAGCLINCYTGICNGSDLEVINNDQIYHPSISGSKKS